MPQYAFSLNGENWFGALATRDEALAAAIQKCSGAADPPATVFVGERLQDEVCTDHLGQVVLQELRSRGRGAEGPEERFGDVTASQLAELDAALEKALLGWQQKHPLTSSRFKVAAISEHLTPVPHRGLRSTHNANGKKEVQDLGVE
jgi:hypothetical protein